MEKLKKIFDSKLNLFLLISLFGIIGFVIIQLLSNDSSPFNWLVMEHNYNWEFSDFFRHIVYASDLQNIYFGSDALIASFPPLAYLFYLFLFRLNPTQYVPTLASWQTSRDFQFNGLIFLMVEIVNVILLYFIIKKYFKKFNDKKILVFFLAVLFSAPFLVGAIERGNAALMTLTFILISLYLKDSENKVFRQLSLIMLAIATGFKLYPGILIVLWLKDKRYKDIFMYAVYCVIFVILPFAFAGGVDGFIQYFKNMFGMENNVYFRWTSIEFYSYSLSKTIGFEYNALIPKIIKYAFLVFSVIYSIRAKEKWKAVLPLATIMAVFIANAFRYVSIYMLIPLIFFLLEDRKIKNVFNYIYTILFALIFSIPIWAYSLDVDLAIFTPIYLLNIVLIIEGIFNVIKNRKIKTENKIESKVENSSENKLENKVENNSENKHENPEV